MQGRTTPDQSILTESRTTVNAVAMDPVSEPGETGTVNDGSPISPASDLFSEGRSAFAASC